MRNMARARRNYIFFGALLVLGVLLFQLFLGEPAGPDHGDPASVTGDAASPGPMQDSKLDAEGRSKRGTLSADRVQPGLRTKSVADLAQAKKENKWVVIGRCVAAEDGRPLPNCEIYFPSIDLSSWLPEPDWDGARAYTELSNYERAGTDKRAAETALDDNSIRDIRLDRFFLTQQALDDLRKKGKFYQTKPDATTDADGRFRVWYDGEPAVFAVSRMFAGSPMRLPRESETPVLSNGRVTDLGTLRLHAGVRVEGRVLSTDGGAIVGATVRILELPNNLPGQERQAVSANCKKGGRFAFSKPIPDGRWKLTVEGDGIASYAEWLSIQGSSVHRRIVVTERPTISGVVQLPRGHSPIELLAISADGRIQGRGVSDKKGRFVIRAIGRSLPIVRLVSSEYVYELNPPALGLRWGTKGLRLEASLTAPLDIQLVDSGGAETLDGEFRISSYPTWSRKDKNFDHWSTSTTGPHKVKNLSTEVTVTKGLFRIDCIRSGPHHLRIRPLGSSWKLWTAKVYEIDIPREAPRRIVLMVDRSTPFQVRVVDAQGHPVAGAWVEALKTGAPPRSTWFNPNGDLYDSGETDAKGKATLYGVPAGLSVDINVRADQFAFGILRAISITRKNQLIQVRLGKGGNLKGMVHPAGGPEAFWQIRLVEKGSKQELSFYVAADGSFEEERLPSGEYDVHLIAGTAIGKRVSALTIQDGGKHELRIQADSHALGQLTVLVQGLPKSVRSWMPYLVSGDLAPGHVYDPGKPISPGGSISGRFPPGSYRLFFVPETANGSGAGYYHSRDSIELKAADKLRTSIQVIAGETRLRVLKVDGSPAAHQAFELQYQHPGDKAWTSQRSLRTDAAGKVLVRQLTPWPMRLVLEGSSQATGAKTWNGEKKLNFQLHHR